MFRASMAKKMSDGGMDEVAEEGQGEDRPTKAKEMATDTTGSSKAYRGTSGYHHGHHKGEGEGKGTAKFSLYFEILCQ